MERLHFLLVAMAALALCACSTTGPQTATATSTPIASPTATVASTAEMEKAVIDLEKKSWELYKTKQAKEYKALLAPGYRSIYHGGVKDADENVKDIEATNIKSYSLSDVKASFPTKDTAILTYKLGIDYTYQGQKADDAFHASSVWVNVGGEWKLALYTEAKVEQPKK
jgi:hypothetical protein